MTIADNNWLHFLDQQGGFAHTLIVFKYGFPQIYSEIHQSTYSLNRNMFVTSRKHLTYIVLFNICFTNVFFIHNTF